MGRPTHAASSATKSACLVSTGRLPTYRVPRPTPSLHISRWCNTLPQVESVREKRRFRSSILTFVFFLRQFPGALERDSQDYNANGKWSDLPMLFNDVFWHTFSDNG